MPDITLPHTFVDGTITDASQIEENLFRSEVTPPTSLSAINGRLDNDNREAGWDIQHQHIQRGALSSGRAIGSTTNHHYFSSNFPSWTTSAANDTDDRYQIIPGAAQTFYLPFTPSLVVFTWSIFTGFPDTVQTAAQVESDSARVRLFIDGERVAFKRGPAVATRRIGEWLYTRQWAGHYFWDSGTNFTKGWHSAGLGLAISCNLANVRVKRFDYVYFR